MPRMTEQHSNLTRGILWNFAFDSAQISNEIKGMEQHPKVLTNLLSYIIIETSTDKTLFVLAFCRETDQKKVLL